MASVQIPHVKVVKGKTYFRIRLRGKPDAYIKLPTPTDPKFAAAYQKALGMKTHAKIDRPGPLPGSFAALITEYRKSTKYLSLRPISRSNTELYLAEFLRRWADFPVSDMTPADVDDIQAELIETPAKANAFISKLSALLNFGVRRQYCTINAASKIERLPIGEHQPWPEGVIEKVLATANPIERLAVITGLCSGQRISDCVRMRHDWITNGTMSLAQQKTSKPVFVPIHPLWQQAMDSTPRRGETILYDRTGSQFSTDGVQLRLRNLMKKLEIAGYTFHGLRKNATNLLADMGCSPHEISSITGMSLEMVIHYTRALDMKRVAERVGKLWKKRSIPGMGNSAKKRG